MLLYYTGATTGKAHEIPHLPSPNGQATNPAEANAATAPQMTQAGKTKNFEGTNQADKTVNGNPEVIVHVAPDDVQLASLIDVADVTLPQQMKLNLDHAPEQLVKDKLKAKGRLVASILQWGGVIFSEKWTFY